jgi:hypothetical protein
MSMILSQKHCEKKLREISILKQKPKHNKEELEKIQNEEYYKNIIKRVYRKILHVIPDDIQQYIWSFVDVNTKLNFLRTIYTPQYIDSKLSSIENSRLTIKKLFSCMKYVERIFTHYLNKDGDNYKKWGHYINNRKYYTTNVEYFMEGHINTLISIIKIGIKNYTRIYATRDKDIHETEKDIIKLFISIKSI